MILHEVKGESFILHADMDLQTWSVIEMICGTFETSQGQHLPFSCCIGLHQIKIKDLKDQITLKQQVKRELKDPELKQLTEFHLMC